MVKSGRDRSGLRETGLEWEASGEKEGKVRVCGIIEVEWPKGPESSQFEFS